MTPLPMVCAVWNSVCVCVVWSILAVLVCAHMCVLALLVCAVLCCVAVGLMWTLYLLAKHPDHQEKCREEVRSVLQGREQLE